MLFYQFINFLSSIFLVKNLGPLHYFLGIELIRTSSGLFLSQSKYISDLLKRTNMHLSKFVSTPMTTSKPLNSLDGCTFDDPQLYRSVVGSLQYLAFTRPNVSSAINRVCQYMHNPSLSHWQAVKRILRYLSHTQHLDLFFLPIILRLLLLMLMLIGLVILMTVSLLEVSVFILVHT